MLQCLHRPRRLQRFHVQGVAAKQDDVHLSSRGCSDGAGQLHVGRGAERPYATTDAIATDPASYTDAAHTTPDAASPGAGECT